MVYFRGGEVTPCINKHTLLNGKRVTLVSYTLSLFLAVAKIFALKHWKLCIFV